MTDLISISFMLFLVCTQGVVANEMLTQNPGNPPTTGLMPSLIINSVSKGPFHWIDGMTGTSSLSAQIPSFLPTALTRTKVPTKQPSQLPSKTPSKLPTRFPTEIPTKILSQIPTKLPTLAPSQHPVQSALSYNNDFDSKITTEISFQEKAFFIPLIAGCSTFLVVLAFCITLKPCTKIVQTPPLPLDACASDLDLKWKKPSSIWSKRIKNSTTLGPGISQIDSLRLTEKMSSFWTCTTSEVKNKLPSNIIAEDEENILHYLDQAGLDFSNISSLQIYLQEKQEEILQAKVEGGDAMVEGLEIEPVWYGHTLEEIRHASQTPRVQGESSFENIL